MKTLAILASILLASCASHKPVIAPRAVIVPKATPAVSLVPVRESSVRIGAASTAIGKESESAGRSVLAARKSAEEAKKLTDIKNKALLETIDQLLAQLSDAENAIGRLNAANADLAKAKFDLEAQVTKAEAESVASEIEKATLRQSLAQANKTIGEDADAIDHLQTRTSDAEKDAAAEKAKKDFWFWWAMISTGILVTVIALKILAVMGRISLPF